MDNQPFFTVITPVYNREAIVKDTIQSVLKQTFTDFEYILVDDCSTDRSASVSEEFMAIDPRLKVIRLSQNEGRCFARNKGLEYARGEWICYLDSDDLFYENHLSTFAELINANKNSKAFATDQHINGELKRYRRKELHEDMRKMTIEDFIEDNPLTANQVCHNSNLKTRWSEERIPISEDWLFMRNLALETPILKMARVTSNLLDHAERSMNTAAVDKFVEFNLIAADKFIQESGCSDAISKRIDSYTLLLCANVYLQNKQKRKAWKLFVKSLGRVKTYQYQLFYKAIVKFILP